LSGRAYGSKKSKYLLARGLTEAVKKPDCDQFKLNQTASTQHGAIQSGIWNNGQLDQQLLFNIFDHKKSLPVFGLRSTQ
jgi:hypothetical protein